MDDVVLDKERIVHYERGLTIHCEVKQPLASRSMPSDQQHDDGSRCLANQNTTTWQIR